MAFTVTLAGKTFTEASFQGNAYADETDGFPAALQKIVEHVANAWVTTSTTSLTIGTGSKSLTVDASKPLGVGQYVVIARTSDATGTWMFGQVTAYNAETGSLTVNVEVTNGAGTQSDWTVSLAGVRGPQGTLTSINDIDDVNTVAVAPSDGSPLVWDNGNGYWAPGEIKESMLSAAVQAKINYTAPSKFDATTAPTANWDDVDTAGVGVEFTIGSVVIDTVGGEAYRCLDASTGAAVWIETTLGTDELGALAVKDTINNADWSGTALAATNGGTGLTSFTAGDIIYASATNTLAKLAKGSNGQILELSSGVPSWQNKPASGLVQSLRAATSSALTTTTIPQDNTKPQQSEGTEILTQAITPTNAANKIRVTVSAMVSGNDQNGMCAALFKDSGADAIAIGLHGSNQSAQDHGIIHFTYEETAGSTTARTFKLRIGVGVGTGYVNQLSSGNTYGGAFVTSLIVEEIAV